MTTQASQPKKLLFVADMQFVDQLRPLPRLVHHLGDIETKVVHTFQEAEAAIAEDKPDAVLVFAFFSILSMPPNVDPNTFSCGTKEYAFEQTPGIMAQAIKKLGVERVTVMQYTNDCRDILRQQGIGDGIFGSDISQKIVDYVNAA